MSPQLHSQADPPRFQWSPVGAFILAGLLMSALVKLGLSGVPAADRGKHLAPAAERHAGILQSEWIQLPSGKGSREPPLKTKPDPTPPSLIGLLETALRELRRESNPELREQRMSVLLDWIMAGDFPSALAFMDAQPGAAGMREVQVCLLRRWAERDPRAAAVAALELGAANRLEAINSVLPLWVQKDPGEALAWVKQMPEGELKNGAQVALGYETVRTDPAMTLEMAMGLPASPESDQLLAHVAMQWATQAPRDAAHWASQIEEDSLRERLLATISTVWGNSDPVSAGELAIASIPAGKAQADALVGIVQRWAQADPASAAAWVAQFPGGKLRTAAMENLASQWGSIDFAKTGDWLNSLPRDASCEAAVGVYAMGLAAVNRDFARSWAAGIHEVQLRTAIMDRLNHH